VTVTGSRDQTPSHPVLIFEAVLVRQVAAGHDRLGVTQSDGGFGVHVTRGGRYHRPSLA
jgi:hypothetical protein